MEKSNELVIRPIVPLADQFKAEHSVSEAEDRSAGTFLRTIADLRRQAPVTKLTLKSESILGLAVS
jgi:hypothetical protein